MEKNDGPLVKGKLMTFFISSYLYDDYQPGHRSLCKQGEESPDSAGQCTG
jgi:hypothetical protein